MKFPLFRQISACMVRLGSLGPQYCVASRETIPLAGAALVAVRLRAFELQTDGYTPLDCGRTVILLRIVAVRLRTFELRTDGYTPSDYGRPLTLPSRALQSAVRTTHSELAFFITKSCMENSTI